MLYPFLFIYLFWKQCFNLLEAENKHKTGNKGSCPSLNKVKMTKLTAYLMHKAGKKKEKKKDTKQLNKQEINTS